MVFVAITKQPAQEIMTPGEIRRWRSGSFWITMQADGTLAKLTANDAWAQIAEPVFERSMDPLRGSYHVSLSLPEKTLQLAKSLSAAKPLYYCMNEGGEFFCSTHIRLLREAGVRIEENASVLPEYFIYRLIMPPATLYKDILQLPLGGGLQISFDGDECRMGSLSFYRLPRPDRDRKNFSAFRDEIRQQLKESIAALLPVRNQTAVLLSGGIDSSIMFQLCREVLGLRESYSCEYPFEPEDLNLERRYALTAASALGSLHTLFQTTVRDYLHGLLEAVLAAEEPVHHHQSVLFHLFFKRGLPADKTFVVQGVGAGGTFGNFRNFLYWHDKAIMKLSRTPCGRAALDILRSRFGRGKHWSSQVRHSACNLPLSHPDNPIWAWHAYGKRDWVQSYFRIDMPAVTANRMDLLRRYEGSSLYDLWAVYSLLGDEAVTLSLWGKLAEANGKQLHSPFYDRDVLNCAMSMPWRLKLKAPENRLRRSIAKSLGVPEFIINRKKSGFGIYNPKWALRGEAFEPLVSLASQAFDEDQIRMLQSENPFERMTFWNILNYAVWKRLMIRAEPLASLQEELDEALEQAAALN